MNRNQYQNQLHESVAAGPSEFARRQLGKMGWCDGEGLGRHQSGITSHIRVQVPQSDAMAVAGIGLYPQKQQEEEGNEEWWKTSWNASLSKLQQLHASDKDKKKRTIDKKKKKKEKHKKSKRNASTHVSVDPPSSSPLSSPSNPNPPSSSSSSSPLRSYTDEELFQLTGGSRFGMRAAPTRNLAKRKRTGD